MTAKYGALPPAGRCMVNATQADSSLTVLAPKWSVDCTEINV
jgi:hypothetical protein